MALSTPREQLVHHLGEALDLHTQLADNITNIVGIGIGTLFRFWTYRKFVFAGDAQVEPIKKAGPR